LINDIETVLELSTFVKSKGSYAADGNAHDDRVMTLVLFAYLTKQKCFKDMTDASAIDNIRKLKQSELDSLAMPVAMSSNGYDEIDDFC
jgi:hypothetical protein